MFEISKELEWVNDTFNTAKSSGVFKAVAEDGSYDGHKLVLNGKEVVFFGNCSYMGLDQDMEVRQAAKDAIDKYGCYFSSSRSFMGLDIFEQMEEKLEQMFEQPVNVTTSTTFAHISNLPLLIGKKDVVIIDHLVHSSLQTALKICTADGIHTEIIRHSRLDLLEDRIKALKETHHRIWYMIDGVYSMMGDGAPMKELEQLMNTYEQFYVYADDAHGTSWTGKNGSGYVMNEIKYHAKLFMGLSMSKGFGIGGGLMIYPDKETKELVKNLGKTMIFSGPPHPSVVMSAIKAAEIQMRPQFADLQLDLKRKIEYFWKKATQLNLPISGNFKTPIFFIGAGTTENIINIAAHLIETGSFVNVCSYPSVPMKNTGLRMTLSRFITYADIDNLLENMNLAMTILEAQGKLDREKVKKAFSPKELRKAEKV
ncbi:aminotransferase class I/II-fold pyridoxal phosphate-dependent enzyme [Lacihabitans lacunae]|uniref:Aminotransferase class I/II-fold pyridoxal phosphate-dependent enzyme n=1 Tax=Lacihabitans lacunae TaxID=1028214 RepID=A0ABV7YU80_9BACT